METNQEPLVAEETKTEAATPTAEEQNAAFSAQLERHVRAFEDLVNKLPNTQSAILFCGAIEKIACDFKEIFIETWRAEMKASVRPYSNSEIKRKLVWVEQSARNLMVAKHIKPS
jgi:hypothetical protein